ncbi:aminotransferase class V-fold PLP-dependent enzyme [symbiont of Argiope bruennichi]|uniref:aminotransferase class V-fold PLP-dependent enzyme n=1 Tax=symbiont of Argiope bruennichi TaxID=2810479 RepID=UPI003DA6C429
MIENNLEKKFLKIKKFFPFFNKNNVIYFDNAGTTQKHIKVIEMSNYYYLNDCANIHSSDCSLSLNALNEYKNCKQSIAKFLNCNDFELFFSSGTTLILNQFVLIMEKILNEGDQILLSYYEHSSNFFPWIKMKDKKKLKFLYLPYKNDFSVDYLQLEKLISKNNIKVISLALTNNNTGEELDILKIKSFLKKKLQNPLILLDAAQAVSHTKIDLKQLDIDFLAFSGHKIYGPTGIGVGYINHKTLNKYNFDPILLGGGAISWCDDEVSYKLKPFPWNFESGTLNIEAIYGLHQAIKFVDNIGVENISNYEKFLQKFAILKLSKLKNIKIYNKNISSSIVLFNVDKVFSQDVASYLSYKNICVRSGDHCAKFLKNIINVTTTVRVSFAIYNNREEVLKFIKEIENGGDFLGGIFR